MSRRARRALFALVALSTLVLSFALAAIWILRSSWFYDHVRQRLISTIEESTGGRVEIAAFRFDWKTLRAEVRGLVLHGREPAGKAPLFRADSIAVGLKVVSIFKRDVDIQYLEVEAPRVNLIIAADGSTNIPEPRIKRAKTEDPIETVLKLKVGRFSLRHGEVDVEDRGSFPFDLAGRQLAAQLLYDANGPRYRGDLEIQPLDVRWNGHPQTNIAVHTSLTFEKNQIGVDKLALASGASALELSGSIRDLAAPRATFQYKANVAAADAARILQIRGLVGRVEARGKGQWSGAGGYSVEGPWKAAGVGYRTGDVALEGFGVSGSLRADSQAVRLSAVQLAGSIAGLFQRSALNVDGSVAGVEVHGDELRLLNLAMNVLGGTFHGDGSLRNFEEFQVSGEIADIAARRVVALQSREALPWDALVSGRVAADGSLAHNGALHAAGELAMAPAAGSAPVDGHVTATYDSRTGIVDLGHSSIHLPSSRVELSGAIGRQLQVYLETRDFNDVLPALGESTKSLPVALDKGDARFDGTVTGKLDDLHFRGHAVASRIVYQGQLIDRVQADVVGSPENVKAQNATVDIGALRAQGEVAVALADWKTSPASLIYGKGSLRNAPVAELAKLAGRPDVPVSGTLDASAEITGTIGNPLAEGDVTLTKAVVRGEPVDRMNAHVRYSGTRVEASSAQLTSGAKQLALSGTFDHPPDAWNTGRLVFQVSSNAMPLDQIHAVEEARPGVKGAVTVTANGAIDLAPPQGNEQGWRIHDLHLNVTGQGLQLADQPIGDVHLSANSQGQTLRAHVDSAFAGSAVTGDGEWQLTGAYAGSATVKFSRLDFANLRQWIAPNTESGAAFGGSAEGELRIDGPALEPQQLRTELRIPKLELLPPAGAVPPSATEALTLRNSGDIVVSMVNSAVKVESARLVGRSTDLSMTGAAHLQPKAGLDLQVHGHVDLALVRDLNRDFQASGTVTTEATVRGTLDSPQVSGRTEFQNASFNIVDLPNGISKANGVITFAGQQATIQSFTGETGGGTISLSGFAGLNSGQLLFRLAARAREVRIRYPEGVSTVANANLSLTGTSDRSMLSGTVTIQRASFNPQSDFSSLIAASAQPVETPSARTGLLGGLYFDVQVNTASDLQFQSSLTQDLQADASLQVKGTFSNPAILGRINITRGQVLFFGTKYSVSQGSVSFYNPLRIEPIIDVSLETKAQGVDVTLTISGPLHHLNLTPSSDPPLSFNEIVALLATGRTPTSDPALLAQQTSAPQSWQQMGASALLGQAIASPVAGRLQRFFGVSNLRIDPAITGVDNTPQARLTLEQQVTPDITFTYITNVTTSNPQVVRVEWSISRRWSAVAVRDENGIFGVDFFFKKRFK
ncbi:MAG TPA: translocation/assembly module TamB domain-containing protein [Verrucomicrobiae bacterium]|nr:translocation/assembly module TamB domain-containing protein [Verrucomicrobiae bacterium]